MLLGVCAYCRASPCVHFPAVGKNATNLRVSRSYYTKKQKDTTTYRQRMLWACGGFLHKSAVRNAVNIFDIVSVPHRLLGVWIVGEYISTMRALPYAVEIGALVTPPFVIAVATPIVYKNEVCFVSMARTVQLPVVIYNWANVLAECFSAMGTCPLPKRTAVAVRLEQA